MVEPTPLDQDTDLNTYPEHLAIIMDGNGRWAQARGLSRSDGHRAGGETLTKLLDALVSVPVSCVSLYAFSTENWIRPELEVRTLWSLMNEFFDRRLNDCLERGIRVVVSGDLSKIPLINRNRLKKVMKLTAEGTALTANFCINYGSRDEIVHALNTIVKERVIRARAGDAAAADEIDCAAFEKYLYTAELPPVDLLIRPGGERRISNFLLWQSAYAELYFTETLFPDFDDGELMKAFHWFQTRKRRYGGLEDQDG